MVKFFKKNNKDNKKKPRAGVFVDNANLFYAQKQSGWKVDFQKLKDSLSLNMDLKVTNYYIAVPDKKDKSFVVTVNYLKKIKNIFNLKIKRIKYIYDRQKVINKKADLDLELALDVVRNLDKLDVVIVMSGDSDFLELKRFVIEKGKKIIFFGFEQNMAWEIKKYSKFLYLDSFEKELFLDFKKDKEFGEKTNSEPKLGVISLELLYSDKKKLSSVCSNQ